MFKCSLLVRVAVKGANGGCCYNLYWFTTLADPRRKIEHWWLDYNPPPTAQFVGNLISYPPMLRSQGFPRPCLRRLFRVDLSLRVERVGQFS